MFLVKFCYFLEVEGQQSKAESLTSEGTFKVSCSIEAKRHTYKLPGCGPTY